MELSEFDEIVKGLEDEIKENMDKIAYEYGRHVFGNCVENCVYCKYLGP